MRNSRFVLSSVCILLAGALAAGFAARAVVLPRTGETFSAGVLSVPTVLGQTAEEVLFYPWPVYDMQTLTPITDAEIEQYGPADLFTAVAAIEALGAEADMEQLIKSQQICDGRHLAAGNTGLRYVKDFPAALGDVPVLLNYAQSSYDSSAVSWLMQPAQEEELSEEQQQEALDKVRNDLAGLIWCIMEPDRNYSNDLMVFLEDFNMLEDSALMFYEWLTEWISLMYYQFSGSFEVPAEVWDAGSVIIEAGGEYGHEPQTERAEPPPLEELLAMGQGEFVDIQFISTPRQIVLLFQLDSATTIGVYYDIQLRCYSGLGLSA